MVKLLLLNTINSLKENPADYLINKHHSEKDDINIQEIVEKFIEKIPDKD